MVSDQLVQEWQENRPDIVIADFITLWRTCLEQLDSLDYHDGAQFAIETTDGPPCFFGGLGSPKTSFQSGLQWLGRKGTRLGNES